jgi:ATP-dependent DNA helicase RecQ
LINEIDGRDQPVDAKTLAEETELSKTKVSAAITHFEEAGAVKVVEGGQVLPADDSLDAESLAEQTVAEQDAFRQYRLGRVELMKDYAETRDCRRRYLLHYFGEDLPEPCGFCDNCEAGLVEKAERANENVPFALKSRVIHKKFGLGTVMRYDADKIVILFDTEGYKSLVTQFLIEHDLLKTEV